MNIYLTGGTGFIGQHLGKMLIEKGYHVTIATRNPDKYAGEEKNQLKYVPLKEEPVDQIADADVVINLAGENIFGKRWTKSVKRRIYDSRILTTRSLVSAMEKVETKPQLFISASGVDYYKDQGDKIITENSDAGDGFLAEVCRDWEAESAKAQKLDVRVVNPRFGVVLGKDGGALATMLPVFKAFIGGSLGPGTQYFPWIHIDDLCRGLVYTITNSELGGAVNVAAPEPVTMNEFTRTLGAVLSRPSFFKVPGVALQAALGEAAEMLTGSHRVVPEKLEKNGFKFSFKTLKPALQDLLLKK